MATVYVEDCSGSTSSSVWAYWNDDATTSTTTDTSVWYNWCLESTSTASTTVGTAATRFPILSREELAEQDPVRKKQQEEYQKQKAERERLEAIALEKSKTLLLEHLDEPNRERLHRDRQIHVWSKSGKCFRIKYGRQHNIFEMNADGKDIREYCIHVKDLVPNYDNMLAQKLMLEHLEEQFLKVANVRQLVS